MDCKLALVALCLFAVGYAAEEKDIWKVLTKSDKFFLVKRTYAQERNQCIYMKVLSRDETKHTLETNMGYRRSTGEMRGPAKFILAVKKGTGSSDEMTVTGPEIPEAGIKYKLEYSEGENCIILKGIGEPFNGKCTLWATESGAGSVGEDCNKKFQERCGEAVETPYQSDCKIPE